MGQPAVKRKPKNAIATMRAVLANEDPVFAYDDRDLQMVMVSNGFIKNRPMGYSINGRNYTQDEYEQYKRCHPNTEFHEISLGIMELTPQQEAAQKAAKARAELETKAYIAKAKAAKAERDKTGNKPKQAFVLPATQPQWQPDKLIEVGAARPMERRIDMRMGCGDEGIPNYLTD